jgi:hypothetical protein
VPRPGPQRPLAWGDVNNSPKALVVHGLVELEHAVAGGEITFHEGRLRGAWPRMKR